MKKVTGDIGQYLVMTDIVVLSDTKIIRGEILDEHDHSLWLEKREGVVPAGTFIRAGSVIEKAESQAKPMISAGVYVNAGETRHFNLEDVFTKQTAAFAGETKDGKHGRPAMLADVLRSHGLHTLESILDNSVGYVPLLDGGKKGGNKIQAHELLKLHASNEGEFQGWLNECQRLIQK